MSQWKGRRSDLVTDQFLFHRSGRPSSSSLRCNGGTALVADAGVHVAVQGPGSVVDLTLGRGGLPFRLRNGLVQLQCLQVGGDDAVVDASRPPSRGTVAALRLHSCSQGRR